MRKLIYAVGSILLAIGIFFVFIGVKTAINYEPSHISATEFKEIFDDKKAYSSIYFHMKNVMLCLDKNASKEQILKNKEKKLKCRSKVRSTKFSDLDEATQALVLKEINSP